MTLISTNPATGDLIETFDEMTIDECHSIVCAADSAFKKWRRTNFTLRRSCLTKLAELLRARADIFAKHMALEMGKPLAQGKTEVEKCAWVCEYYANNGEEFLSPRPVQTENPVSYVSFQPVGVVLAVMPWNFPHWQVFRFLAPALMAGNAGLLKHASNVTRCALDIEEVVRLAGFPPDLFRVLRIGSSKVADVISQPLIRAVTLTCSTPAGRAVAECAGKNLKKCVLELGGSDPYIILEDADLELAATKCVGSRLMNSGQSCIAAKRFIAVESIYDLFVRRYVDIMSPKKVGDPLQSGIDLGPMARVDLRDELHQQVQESVSKGARLLLGGVVPKTSGAYYPPTVLADVVPGMPAYDQELFGPVASIIKAKDKADAISIANSSVFGLGAAVFTKDTSRGLRIAEFELEAGCCFVNQAVHSDPRLPFGGIKESGYGRELGPFGIHEFVNIKSVVQG